MNADKQTKYNLENYNGKNIAEKTLNFIHAVLTNDPSTMLIPFTESKRKCIFVQESDGEESMVYCDFYQLPND